MQSGLNLALGKITINYNFNHFSLQWHNKRNLKARSDQKTQLMPAFSDLALNKHCIVLTKRGKVFSIWYIGFYFSKHSIMFIYFNL